MSEIVVRFLYIVTYRVGLGVQGVYTPQILVHLLQETHGETQGLKHAKFSGLYMGPFEGVI